MTTDRLAELEARAATLRAELRTVNDELDKARRAQPGTTTEWLWERCHDKYGRRAIQLDRIIKDADGNPVARDRRLAVVIRMPKSYIEDHGPHESYLVSGPGNAKDRTRFLATAKTVAEQMVTAQEVNR